MDEQLTGLQKIILEIDRLNLPLRDAMRLATQRVGFFVGQERYLKERARALAVAQGELSEPASESA
jgi:hypothetical protein